MKQDGTDHRFIGIPLVSHNKNKRNSVQSYSAEQKRYRSFATNHFKALQSKNKMYWSKFGSLDQQGFLKNTNFLQSNILIFQDISHEYEWYAIF